MARSSIREVASRAGVSTMTVSRVLRGEGDSQYQERVLEAVRALDYVPVRSALQNRHVKTNSIGVLLDGEFVFETYLGFKTFAGLSQEAFANNYDLLMLQPKQHQPLEKQKLQFLDRRCDGFVFVVTYEAPEVLELLIEHQFPVVVCYSTDVPDGVATIGPDNDTPVRQAVQIMRDAGHERIAFWSGGTRHSDSRYRLTAFEEAMEEAGLETVVQRSLCGTALQSREALDSLLAQGVTAVICHNDERALGLWDAARERGLSVPDDLSLIGIDDIPVAAERGLTTFTNSFGDVGKAAAAALVSLMNGGTVVENSKKLPMPLAERNSVAPPK